VNQGFPLVGFPGANVYFTDHDATTPLLPDGTRDVSCKRIPLERGLYDVAKAARYLVRLAELIR
jgi:hypothetical protein